MEIHLADIWELEGAPLPNPPPPLPCPGLSLGGRTLTLKETGVQGPKRRVSSPEELRLKAAGGGGGLQLPPGQVGGRLPQYLLCLSQFRNPSHLQ